MRRAKRFSLMALGLIPLLLLTAFLPAGAAVTKSGQGDTSSQELVICETDPSGVIQKVRVFDTLGIKETPGGGTIDFKEEYLFGNDKPSKITGVNSFAKPELDGDYLVWKGMNTGSNSNTVADIELSKAMVDEAKTRIPLKVDYKYYFNGKLVEGPEAIAGKSGHFRLEATFTNTSGEKTPVPYKDPDTGETLYQNAEVYLPLVILPYDWKFDNQHFFNLEVDGTAVLIPKPDVYQPGWTIPLFPPATDKKQSIWVEADVKDFRMPALSLVVSFVFPETNQVNALDQLGPGLKELYGGIKTLDEGLTEAVVGLGSAATPDTLIYGIGQIYDGLLTLSSNTEGLGYAKSNIDSGLVPGVNQLYGGTDQLIGAMGGAKSGIAQLMGGLDQAMAGISSGDPSNPGIKEGLQLVVGSLNGLLIPGLQEMRAGIGPASDPDSLLGQINNLITFLTVPLDPTVVPPGGTIDWYVNVYGPALGRVTSDGTDDLNDYLDGMASELQGGLLDIQRMYDSLGDGTVQTTIIGGLFYMSAVLTSMINGIGDAATTGTLLNGLAQIKMGLVLLDAGIGDAANPNSLIGGVTQIKYGLSSGSNANPGVKEGLVQLSGGLGTAIAGLGSAGTPDTLLYGAGLIEGGLNELQGGLTQATTGGTQVMITGLNGSISTINLTESELEAVTERAAEYNAFLGEPLDGDSMVRFIYQTPAVYSYDQGNSASHWTAIILSLIIAIALVLMGLFAFRKLA